MNTQINETLQRMKRDIDYLCSTLLPSQNGNNVTENKSSWQTLHDSTFSPQARCKQIWEEAKKLPFSHPYIIYEGITPINCKLVTQNYKDCHVYKNTLIVPYMDEKGEILSLQRIFFDKKEDYFRLMNIAGIKTSGMYCPLPLEQELTNPTYITEDWATGCKVHEKTSCKVLVAFSSGNVFNVLQDFEYNHTRINFIVIVGEEKLLDETARKHIGYKCMKLSEIKEKDNVQTQNEFKDDELPF